jgi:hypothetical protein
LPGRTTRSAPCGQPTRSRSQPNSRTALAAP